MAWPDWLSFVSDQLAIDYPGETGLFLAAVVGALGCQARELGATSPSEHERLAQDESDRAAAWLQALQAEAASPGIWTITTDPEADPDDVTDLGPDDHDPGARRGWIATRPTDPTFRN